jgi:chemosensory pili system protein ChpA (sensor histidine kinase/response regulator)
MTSSHTSHQSLKWTRPLIDELCGEIQQTLEQWADEEADRSEVELAKAADASRKISGSLSVLEYESGEMLGETMAQVVEALDSGDIDEENQEAAVTAILEATASLPDYLDYLESTHRDAPLVLLSTINLLREHLDQPQLEVGDFFNPPLESVELPEGETVSVSPGEIRREYQHALRGFLVDNDNREALETLQSIGLKIRDQAEFPDSIRRTGWSAAGLVSALLSERVVSGPDTARLFARLDVVIKQLGEDQNVDEAADPLCRDFLFHVADAGPSDDLAGEVYSAFDLSEHATGHGNQTQVFLAGQNRALFAAVTQAAREDLAQIKDTLGSQLEGAIAPDVLEQQTTLLESVGESLSMLGLENLARRIKGQASRLSDLSADPDDPALLTVARELLIVESQLEDSFSALDDTDDSEDASSATLLPPSEQKRILRQLLTEALEDLTHAKSLLDALNRGKADADAASEAHEALDRISSALYMAELDDGARLIDGARWMVRENLIESSAEAEHSLLETLAEALTVAELYLESMAELDQKGREHFATAQKNLESLGYWPDEEGRIERAESPTDSEAPADSPTDEADLESEPEEPFAEETAVDEASDTDEMTAEEFPTAESSGEDATDAADEFDLDDESIPNQEEGSTEAYSKTEAMADTTASDLGSDFDDFDIVEIFLEEFDQELESLSDMLDQWRKSPDDNEIQVTIRRSFHSLKGSGRMAGASEIGEYSWEFENLMNQVLEGKLKPSENLINLVASGIEALPSMRARLSGEGEAQFDESYCAQLANRAHAMIEGKDVEDEETAAETHDESSATAPELEGMDPTLIELMIKELSENLETLDDWLAEADENGMPGIVDDPLVRAVHTMKGTMRLAPIRDESETAQLLEQYLEELAHTNAPPTESGHRAIEQCGKIFRLRLDRLQGSEVEGETFDTAALSEELRRLHNQAHRDSDASHQLPPTAEEELEEPLFSSDADSSNGMEGSDFDVFGIDEEQDDEAPSSEPGEEVPEREFDDSLEDSGEVEAEADEFDTVPAEDPDELADTEQEPPTEEAPDFESEESVADLDEEEPEEFEADSPEQIDAEADEADLESKQRAEEEIDSEADREADMEEREADFESSESTDEELIPEPEGAEEDITEEESEETAKADRQAEAEALYAGLNEDILEAFLEEAQEVLEHADDSLQQWRESPDDKAMITGLQRDLHTIKGSSRMVGLEKIGGVAHVMEELLEGIAAGLKAATPERIDALETGCDHLHAMVDAVVKREPMPEKSVDELMGDTVEEIEPEAEEDQADLTPATADQTAEETTQIARTENLRVPMDLVDDLVNYAGEISIFRSRLEEQVTVFRVNVAEIDETVIRLRDQLRKLEIETEAQILARYEREHGPADETFDPLELDRYSTIQQLSRGLGESVSDLTSLTGILDDATRKSETLLMQQSRVNTELQEGLMQARMVSFNTLLPRLRRVVRNAARELDKKAELSVQIEGDGELDRSVLDRITAPIEHLLRNAISHGIEMPDTRRENGKDESGNINIDVSREATELVIRVQDDGAGLNLDAIRRRGLEQGLITEAESDEDTIAQLIFRPGFSTAKQVSQLAGRGIGMDVVANEVRQIGGGVDAHTDAGKGTRFTIRIPLSLTVMQAIMVRVAERQFCIPLQAVRGVTRMLTSEWQRQIGSDEPHQEYAGGNYPLLELEPQLGFEAEELPDGTLSLLMIEAGEHRAALRVTELQGHREIVIKPVGPQISSITGILGGTITGDGQVVPILDMGPLIRQAFERDLLPGHEVAYEQTEEIKRTPLIMVVDDSITMRRVTARVLEHRGLEVLTARDGLDAVESMFDRVPDLILLDIEMPRMDGYELATHVRNDPRLKDVPMIMITSRSGEKHRQHARELGVNGYLTKPYQEADLIEQVYEHLKIPAAQG